MCTHCTLRPYWGRREGHRPALIGRLEHERAHQMSDRPTTSWPSGRDVHVAHTRPSEVPRSRGEAPATAPATSRRDRHRAHRHPRPAGDDRVVWPGSTLATAARNGYHPVMQHEVGIRRGTRARFVLPGTQQRDPRSGLLRLFPVRSQPGPVMSVAALTQPVRAIRMAARSSVRPTAPASRAGAVLATPDRTRWNPPRSRLRDPRGDATPWRG